MRLGRLGARLREELAALLGRALMPGQAPRAFSGAPVDLIIRGPWKGRLSEGMLDSLAQAEGASRVRAFLEPEAFLQAAAWAEEHGLALQILRLDVDPAAAQGPAAAPSPRLLGVLEEPLLFHSQWLSALERLASAGPWVHGRWCPAMALSHRDPFFGPAPRARAAAAEGQAVFEQGQPGAWGHRFSALPEIQPGRLAAWALSLGALKPHVLAPEQSLVDHLDYFEARLRKEGLEGLAPALALRPEGWPAASQELIPYNHIRYLQPRVQGPAPDGIRHPVPVDLVLLAVPKDLAVLPFALEGARRNLDHPVGRVLLIGPEHPALRDFCGQAGCEFVDEAGLSPVPRGSIGFQVRGTDRSGWIFQQFLKYQASTLVQGEHYFIVDADTVLLRPQRFGGDGLYRPRCADEFHLPYFRSYEKLTGYRSRAGVSFTAHQMLFHVPTLRRLQTRMRAVHGVDWPQAILGILDPHEMSCVSDYESYGCWLHDQEEVEVKVEHWRNIALPRPEPAAMPELLRWAARDHDSASFHHHHAAR